MRPAGRFACGVVAVLLLPFVVRGDAIVRTFAMNASTIAEIFVGEETLAIELEIGAADLRAFTNVLPDDLHERLRGAPEPLDARLERFFEDDFVIADGVGRPLVGELVTLAARDRIRRDEVTGQPLPTASESGRDTVLFVRLEYEMPDAPPTLVFDLPAGSAVAAASVGFVAYHRGVAVNDFRYLSSSMELRLDWNDPWYTEFGNDNLRRQFAAPFSVFLYAEHYEVRQEIVLRPLDLQRWVDLGLEGKDVITVAEQPEITRRVVEFFTDNAPIRVDGVGVEKRLDRAHFIFRNLRTSGVIDPPRDLDIFNATIGVIYYVPVPRLPDRVEVDWSLFDDRVPAVPASATDEAGALPFTLSEGKSTLTWDNFLQDPSTPGLVALGAPPAFPRAVAWLLLATGVAIAAGGAGLVRRRRRRGLLLAAVALGVGLTAVGISELQRGASLSGERSGEIVRDLLGNVYAAFDYRQEDRIYDTLAETVSGDLLTDVYLETIRGLELENQGGARARVQQVEMVAAEASPLTGSVGFSGEYTWNVYASVGHWGHLHQRVNQYVARVVVEAASGAWRITGIELLQEERL